MLDIEGSASFADSQTQGASNSTGYSIPLLKTKAAKLDFEKSEALKKWLIYLLSLIIPIVSHFLNQYNASFILLISLSSAIAALYIFRDSLFDLIHKMNHEQYEHLVRIDPFREMKFYLAKCDVNTVHPSKKSIFVVHDTTKNEVTIIGGIQLEKIAMMVHPNLKNFLTGLYVKNIPVYFENKFYSEANLNAPKSSMKKNVYSKFIYKDPADLKHEFNKIEAVKYKKESEKKHASFSILTDVKVSLNQPVREALDNGLDLIQRNLNTILRSVSSNFSHYRFDVLTDETLINKIQSAFFDSEYFITSSSKPDSTVVDIEKQSKRFSIFIKMGYLMFFGLVNGILFNNLMFGAVCGAMGAGFLHLKENNKQDLSELLNFQRIDPFGNIEFIAHKRNPNAIFIHIPTLHMVRGIRPLSIQGIGESFNLNIDKVFREQLFDMVSTISSIQAIPIRQNLSEFQEEFVNYMDSRNLLSPRMLEVLNNMKSDMGNKEPGDITINYPNFCTASGGIWLTKYTISVIAGVENYFDLSLAIARVSDLLNDNLKRILDILITKFRDVAFRDLSGNPLHLIPRFLLLKNSNNYMFGSLLPQFPMSGSRLSQLISLPAEYQKAIETIYPAEFQAPINLSVEIVYGKIINTEFIRDEALYGFNYENIFDTNLLFGGNDITRFKIALKMMYENIIMNIPTLIVDIHGYWKHMLSLFKGTVIEHNIQILNLGKNYGLNPFYSEIENDETLDSYLSSITSIFSYLYRIQMEDEALLKECLYSTPAFELKELDPTKILSMMDLRLTDTKSEMRKISLIYAVMQEFGSSINLKAFRTTPSNSLSFTALLTNPNCVILDLSSLEQRKRYFAALVILKKISHILKQNHKQEIKPAMIYLPEVDKLFHNQNTSRTNTEFLIPQLFSGILEHGFGIFCECGSINDLHKEFIRIVNNCTVLEIHTEEELRVASETLKLDRYFSNENNSQFRRNSYQFEFLKHLKENQALVRRKDHEFPFAVQFDLDYINSHFKVLDPSQFDKNNTLQGTEKNDSQNLAQKTIELSQFERDFSEFKFLIKDIAKFLLYLKELEKTTEGLSKKAIREELDQAIGEKIYIQVHSSDIKNRKLKNIIETLIAKEYLIKNPHTLGKAQNKTILYITSSKVTEMINEWKLNTEIRKSQPIETSALNTTSKYSQNQSASSPKDTLLNSEFFESEMEEQISPEDLQDIQENTNELNGVQGEDSDFDKEDTDLDGMESELNGKDLDLDYQQLEWNEEDLDLDDEKSESNKEDLDLDGVGSYFEGEDSNLGGEESELNEKDPDLGDEESELNGEDLDPDDEESELNGQEVEFDKEGLEIDGKDLILEGKDLETGESDSETQKIEGYYEEFNFEPPKSALPKNSKLPLTKENLQVNLEADNDSSANTLEKYTKKTDPEIKIIVKSLAEKPENLQSISPIRSIKETHTKTIQKIPSQNSWKENENIEIPLQNSSKENEHVKNQITNIAGLQNQDQKQKQEIYFKRDESQQFYERESKEKIKILIQNVLTPKKIEIEIKLMAKQFVEAAQLIRNSYGAFFVKYFDINSAENPTRESLLLYIDRILNENKKFPLAREDLVSYLNQFEFKIKNPDEIKESKKIFEKFLNILDYYVSQAS